MPYRAVAYAALEDWRRAEREMAQAAPGSRAWRRANADAVAAKARYEQAIADARAAHMPEPPTFDDARRESIEDRHRRAAENIASARETVRRTIEMATETARNSTNAGVVAKAQERIIHGERELSLLDAEAVALSEGDHEAFKRIAEEARASHMTDDEPNA